MKRLSLLLAALLALAWPAQAQSIDPIARGMAARGNIKSGTTPIVGCSAGQFIYNNSGVVGCSASSATIAFPQAVTGGTSGGIPYFSATTTLSSSAALAANALVIGGGAGVAPSTITTGTGVVTALGVNVGSAGAFVTNGGALGTPSSATLTNATGLPISTGVSGLGTGNATALAVNLGSAGALVRNNAAETISGAFTMTSAAPQLTLGANATTLGSIKLFGNTSGDLTLQPTAAAGAASVATFPARSGTVAYTSGALTSGNCAKFDASGNIVDNGAVCGGGGGSPGGATNSLQVNSGSSTFVAPTSTAILGGADAATATNITLTSPSISTGTSNTAGGNLTVDAPKGTGTGTGGSFIVRVAPAGTTGTSQNAMATALTIDSTKLATFAGNINMPATFSISANSTSVIDFGITTSGYTTLLDSTGIQFKHSTNVFMQTYNGSSITLANNVAIGWNPNANISGTGDVIIYRNAAGILNLRGSSGTSPGAFNFYTYGASPPSAPGASQAIIYADTSGAKIRIMALFPSGVAQQIAAEP